jgi:hypothetical protein
MHVKAAVVEKKIEYLVEKVDLIEARIETIDKTLSVNTTLLGDHIRRTELLEEHMEPVRRHLVMMSMVSTILTWILGTAVAILIAYLWH